MPGNRMETAGKVSEGQRKSGGNGVDAEKASTLPAPSLERELQRDLNQARVVLLTSYLPKRTRAERCIRRSELWMVEQVKEFCSELEAGSFGNRGSLEDRPIEVVDAVRAKRRIYSRLASETPSGRSGKARRIDPPRATGRSTQSRFRSADCGLVATGNDIGS